MNYIIYSDVYVYKSYWLIYIFEAMWKPITAYTYT